jgi:hypothetical protein
MEQALKRYALIKHVMDDAPSNDPGWIRMDSVVLNWISNSIIRRYSPFLNFLKVRDDLLLEEIHMDSTEPPAAPTALYTKAASLAAKPPSSTPSRPPNGGNGGTGGNRNKNNNKNHNSGNGGGNNGKNSNSGGGRGGSSGQTTTPIGSDGRTNAPWPTYGHPWQGHMTMYPGPVLVGQ